MDSVLKSPHVLLKLSMPPVMLHLMSEAVKPEPDFAVLARAISMDPVLASTVLSLVNSPFYGLTQKVTDLQRAAVVLGSREIIKIAFSIAYQQDMQNRTSCCGYDMRQDWRMMLWSAIAAEELARMLCPEEADHAYLCGLLKDVSLLLMYCASSEDLPPGHRCEPPVTQLRPGQLEEEEEHWGMPHGSLTQLLLTQWGLPGEFGEPIRRHHEMDAVEDVSPLEQALILSTRWAEVELGREKAPFDVVQFKFYLRELLAISDQQLDELRSTCTTRFESLAATLDMEGAGGDVYCRHTLEAMQNYYFMSMDLLTASGGLYQVARSVGRHLKLNWDVEDWNLALKSPHGRGYTFFACCATGVEEGREYETTAEVPWTISSRGAVLGSGGTHLGELRIDRKLDRKGSDSIMLYLRFLSQAFELYCAKHAVMEEKALVLDALPIAVAWLTEDGRIRETNTGLKKLMGTGKDYRGAPLASALEHELDLDLGPEWATFSKTASASVYSRLLCLPRDGDDLYLYVTGRRKKQDRGILFLMEDLGELSGVELQSIKQLNFLENMLQSMQDIVLTVDRDGIVLFASDKRYTGQNLFRITTPSETFPGVWGAGGLEDCHEPVEAVFSQSSGNLIPCELVVSPLNARAGQKVEYLVMVRDLSRVRRLEGELKRQAMVDGLTGLFNHYQFHSILDRELRRCRRTGGALGLLFFDLDGFKEINDTQGHQVGDDILARVGRTLLATVRKGTDFPCRYGGDEFAVVFTDVDAEQLKDAGRRVVSVLRKKLEGRVSCSAGLSILRADDSVQSILGRADRGAYSAKAHGGDRLLIVEE